MTFFITLLSLKGAGNFLISCTLGTLALVLLSESKRGRDRLNDLTLLGPGRRWFRTQLGRLRIV